MGAVIDPEAAFHALAIVVLGLVALVVALVLWWAIRHLASRLKT